MMRNRNIANAGWIIGCKIIQAVLGLVISMLTARYLGPSQFGVINYAAAVVAFFAPIAQLGLNNVIVQEIVYSPESEGKVLGSSVLMSLVSSFFCIIGVVAFSAVANPGDDETTIVCTLYSVLMISQSLEFVQYWFQAKLMSKYSAVVSVVVFALISVYKAILILTNQSVYWFAVSNAIDHLIIGVVLLYIYKKKNGHKLSFSLDYAKRLFNKSKFFIVSSMMVTIFAQTDKVMLKFMIDETATGIYSAASACASMTSFVFVAIIDSMRPTILENKKKADSLYATNMCRLYSVIIFMALAQSLAMTLFSKPIIWILYGKEYFDAIPVLAVVVWQTAFSYIGGVRNIWILAEEKQQYLWIINLSGALTNVVLNLILIPLWGVIGAAVASVITQFFTNFVIGFILRPIRQNNVLILKSMNPRFLTDMIKILARKRSL